MANNFPMPMSGSSGMEDHHLLASDILCQTSPMRNLTAAVDLTIAVLLGSVTAAQQSIQKRANRGFTNDFFPTLADMSHI